MCSSSARRVHSVPCEIPAIEILAVEIPATNAASILVRASAVVMPADSSVRRGRCLRPVGDTSDNNG